MAPNECFEQALQEYRERSWYPDEYADLPTDVQDDIMKRAWQIQAADNRLNELAQAA